MIIRTPNEVDEGSPYLDMVWKDMQRLGPPRIRAWWNEDLGTWDAIEGSHRAHVAWKNRCAVIIVPVHEDDLVEHDVLDLLPGKETVRVILRTLKKDEDRGELELNDDLVSIEGSVTQPDLVKFSPG